MELTVALVSPSWPAGSSCSGVTTYVAMARPGLEDRGARVVVLAHRVDDHCKATDVFCIRGEGEGAMSALIDRALRRIAPRYASERLVINAVLRAVHRVNREVGLHVLEMEETFGWAGVVAQRSPVPVVVRLHCPACAAPPDCYGVQGEGVIKRRIRLERHSFERAHGVTAPSRAVLDAVRRHYGLELEKARIIPNPIAPVPPEERWRLDGCDPDRILFVGRFDACKGADTVIDAFVLLAKARSRCRLTFAGQDSGLRDAYGKIWKLEEYVRERVPEDLRSRIDFLNVQAHDRLARLRRAAYATVVPSRYESFSYTAVEAMAAGCPLIASDAGGLSEIVEDGVNGLLCRPGSPEDLAGKLEVLLRDRSLVERLGLRAAMDCERRYHPSIIAGQMLEFYREVIERWNGCRH